MLKILIISTSQMNGGAAIAANRLMKALNGNPEVKARMLVRDCGIADAAVAVIPHGVVARLRFIWERGVIWMNNRFSRNHLFEVSIANTGFDVTLTEEFRESDVIHIHWTQQGMLSLKNMKKIFNSGKPVVWTMHDMWACTGICHYSDECDKFQTQCSNCRYLRGNRTKDLSFVTFNKKRKLFDSVDFNIVTCSHWLESKALSSALLNAHPISCIANAIDTAVFKPHDRMEVRRQLQLPSDKPLILFASQKVTDKRKGIDYLVEAAHLLKARNYDVEFIVMGSNADQVAALLPYPVHAMGFVSSVEKAAMMYQAADMFVTPSLMDNLPNTIAESLACGTPCVGFDIGGIPEMIDHLQNGYVAQYKNTADFTAGIEWILNCRNKEALGQAAVSKARSSFSQEVVASQHIELYKALIQDKR